MLGEASSDSDGPTSIVDEDRDTVHECLFPRVLKGVQPTKQDLAQLIHPGVS